MDLNPSVRPKILVIRLSSLGDIVLTTSVLAPLRAAGFEITFLAKNSFASLLQGQPGLELHAYDSKTLGESRAKDNFFEWFEKQNFSFVLDLQDSWRTWSWRSRLSERCPVYVAKKERFRELGILLLRLRNALSFGAGGRAKKFWTAAKGAAADEGKPVRGEALAQYKTELHANSEDIAAVKPMLPTEPFVAILPASAWKGKEWPYFKELAQKFTAPVVTLGGVEDEICDAVAGAARQGISLRGKTSMRQSMAVLSQATWIIGNDTGMVHVGEALGKDVAMIEGPTHAVMGFSPFRPKSLLLGLDLICRPCGKAGKICWRFGTRKCLYGLSAEEVASRLRAGGYPC